MRVLIAFAATLVAVGCGGRAADGGSLFERAERALGRADALRAHLTVHAPVSVDRTATIRTSDLPLKRLRLARWAKGPRRFACGHGFECARASLDADAVVRELGAFLRPLPVDPASVADAHVAVRLDSRGDLRRVDLDGEAYGVRVEVALQPLASSG